MVPCFDNHELTKYCDGFRRVTESSDWFKEKPAECPGTVVTALFPQDTVRQTGECIGTTLWAGP